MWFASKQLSRDRTLADFLGRARVSLPTDFVPFFPVEFFYPPERIASMVVLTEFMMLVELKRRLDADFILENAEEHRGFEAVFMGVQLRFFAVVVHYGS